jgi:crotonobetainyl-CoA:carnitine CoA-transferase CaiB-like acyl-CoA transferase
MGALESLRVIEIGDETGVYCGKLLADMGADVIRAERRGGDALRWIGPFVGGKPDAECGVLHLFANTNKRSIELDPEDVDDHERLHELMAGADLVVESLTPGRLDALGLGYESLAMRNPALVFTSITGFGQTGPWRDYRWTNIVADALGGSMYVNGEPDDPPVALAGCQALASGGVLAACSSLIALHHAARTGEGQHVDISLEEAVASVSHITGVGRWLDDGVIPRRSGSALTASCPSGAFPCRDGLIYLMVNRPGHWAALARWINEETGNEEVLQSEFEGPSSSRIPYRELLDLFIGELTSRYTVREVHEEAQRRHIAMTPVSDVEGLICDPQLISRGFFVELAGRDGKTIQMPGAPFRHSRTPWRLRRPAPRVGEHAAEVEAEGARAPRTPRPARERDARDAGKRAIGPGALADLRVVEFGAGMAGPWIGRTMAWCGAEVVKVESQSFPDVTRLFVSPRAPERGIQTRISPWFTDWNAGKRFVSLDLEKPESVELVKRLVARADVLVENYSAGTLSKLGLGSEAMREANPRIIHLRSTGFGTDGPYRDHVSWGPNIEAHSGLAWLSGFPERPCTLSQYAYPDAMGALHGIFAILAALEHRDRTGEGQSIDLSQLEVMINGLGERVMAEQVEGGPFGRMGNRSFHEAPQGCYACAGEDRWLALSVPDDEAFAGLCALLEQSELVADPRFATLEARRENADELDAIIGEWTGRQKEYDAMALLQSAGVAAGVVQTTEDQLRRDPQLEARGYLERIHHLVKGEVIANGIALGLTGTPGKTPRAGEALGQDNDYVFGELLGIDAAERERLVAAGVIEKPPDEG